MKSLERIHKLNEDPALRDGAGITAGKLAARWASRSSFPISMSVWIQVFFEDCAVVLARAENDGQTLALYDVLEPED